MRRRASPRRSRRRSRRRWRSCPGWSVVRYGRSCSASGGGCAMASLLNADVEILKLARLVDATPEQLGYLRHADPQDIRDLREQVTVVMFDADRQMLQRVAAATKLIPAKLAALIGERAFGPLLCARLTGLLEPSRAVDIAAKLPTP